MLFLVLSNWSTLQCIFQKLFLNISLFSWHFLICKCPKFTTPICSFDFKKSNTYFTCSHSTFYFEFWFSFLGFFSTFVQDLICMWFQRWFPWCHFCRRMYFFHWWKNSNGFKVLCVEETAVLTLQRWIKKT